jgi:protoporphyrin/coproporphyrin ferrochelatase
MTDKTGVLLINLGTPDAPTAPAIRRFLREFLSDRRVVNLPPALWYPVLYGFILPLRPRRLVRAYSSIWGADGSPLLALSRKLAGSFRQELTRMAGRDTPVALGMRYGTPSLRTALDELETHRPSRLLVLPLYPQYSGTTTASALDGVGLALQHRDWQPSITVVNDYHDHDGYIAALRDSVQAHWQAYGRGEKLLMSFHGIPMKYVEAGDPYLAQCRVTARALAEALSLPESAWEICFQSRVGRARWTSPYVEARLVDLARSGVNTVDVVCPGFAVDCLETLEEIALRDKALFESAGGQSLRYIPALNDQPAHAAALARITTARLSD